MTAFATPAELSAYTKGAVSATDPRAQATLDAVTGAIQRRAGWHIAPAQQVTEVLDGPRAALYLQSLRVNAIHSVSIDGTVLQPSLYEWSRRTGNVRRRNGQSFPDTWGGVEVVYDSGYPEVPADLKQIVLQVSSLALSSPSGATREQAGQVAISHSTTAPGVAGGLTLLDRDLAVTASHTVPKE